MRFFADHCVPRSVCNALKADEHDVALLRDHLPPDAPDRDVIQQAQTLDSVLLTLNGDFANLIRYPPDEYGGIVALQVRNRPEVISQIVDRLLRYLQRHPELEHYAGTLFLVEPHRIRIRRGQ